MDEREFELINIIGGALGVNQRDLSRQMNLSLGMTNMLMRRLITKGYIRIKQLNNKKVEYLLTPRGFTEKMRKSVRYTMKTLGSIGLIRQSLGRLLAGLHAQGVCRFYCIGSPDLVLLIELAIRENDLMSCGVVRVEQEGQIRPDGVVLLCCEKTSIKIRQDVKVIDVVEVLAGDQWTARHSFAQV